MNWLKSQITLLKHERRAILMLTLLLAILWLRQLSLERKTVSIIPLNNDSKQLDSLEFNQTSKNDAQALSANSKTSNPNRKIKEHENLIPNTKKDNHRQIRKDIEHPKPVVTTKTKPLVIVDFDPNTVDYKQLIEMGIDKKVASNWSKFLSAGATFYKTEDVLKIYGLEQSLYKTLLPHLKIEKPKRFEKAEALGVDIELNSADADLLMQLYGIGPKLSDRIIKYRDILGGFHSLDQLAEVYGLPDSTIQSILPKLSLIPVISKININSIEEKELAGHPYLSYKAAEIIIKYRIQHGPFSSIDELDRIKIFDSEELKKIKAYLTI